MASKDQTITAPEPFSALQDPTGSCGGESDALVIAWSYAEPERIGEVAFLARGPVTAVLGRGRGEGAQAARVEFIRQRPGTQESRGPLNGPAISRDQLRLRPSQNGLVVERCGRCPLVVNGRRTDEAVVKPGELIFLRGQLLLLYTRRPQVLAPLKFYSGPPLWPFGEPDPAGIVGESPAMWQVRDDLAFAAQSERHVLVTGPSGTGKELAATAIHLLSSRGSRPIVARSAATLPPGLIDAELFGNAKNFPNPGMADRLGLIGEADGSTLFLDEIGEMPLDGQAHLLRVLDRQGEYQRLGESRPRRSSFCLVAATNRDPASIKHDVLARFSQRVCMPPLHGRREDIPLMVRHALRKIAAKQPHASGFFEGGDIRSGQPRVAPELIEHLMLRPYTHHMRELERVLLDAVRNSSGPFVSDPSLAASVDDDPRDEAAPQDSIDLEDPPGHAGSLTRQEVIAALGRNNWVIRRAWQELGLTNRYQLYRLMEKFNVKRTPPNSG